MIQIGPVTAEVLLIWTNVPRTNVAWTNVVVTVVICCSQGPLFKVWLKLGKKQLRYSCIRVSVVVVEVPEMICRGSRDYMVCKPTLVFSLSLSQAEQYMGCSFFKGFFELSWFWMEKNMQNKLRFTFMLQVWQNPPNTKIWTLSNWQLVLDKICYIISVL